MAQMIKSFLIPTLEATMAKTIHATTTTIPGANHVVMVSHPDAVASVIESAAGAK
jgi:pimeloyl-ACP methyl ester carboxylesterase